MNFIPCKCPECGGDLQIPDNKDIVKCMYCTVDIKVREIISVQASNPKNLKLLAENAFESGNFRESENYCTRILEIEPNNVDAWFKKGLSAGWRSNLSCDSFNEMFTCIDRGLSFCKNESEKIVYKMMYVLHIYMLCDAYFQLSLNHTLKFSGVNGAIIDHVERCRNVVMVLERVHLFDPDMQEIPDLIVDISSRQMKFEFIPDDVKYYFQQKIIEFTSEKTPRNLVERSKKEGCFVVTAIMGDDKNMVVQCLRNFRDEILMKSNCGMNFVQWYYGEGPKIAKFVSSSFVLRAFSFIFIVLPLFLVALCVLKLFKLTGGPKIEV